MSLKRVLFYIAILITVDQIIKVMIYNYFFEYKFEIIPSLLEYHPVFNKKYSYFSVLFNKSINKYILLLCSLIIMYLMILFYSKSKKKYNILLLDYCFIFSEAGFFSAFLGYFWEKGVLDYIYLKPLFIFDLKDIYLCIFELLLPVYLFKKATCMK